MISQYSPVGGSGPGRGLRAASAEQVVHKPDRTRALGQGRLELVDLEETTVGRVTLPAGWRWSTRRPTGGRDVELPDPARRLCHQRRPARRRWTTGRSSTCRPAKRMRSRPDMTPGSWATRPTSRSSGPAPGCTASQRRARGPTARHDPVHRHRRLDGRRRSPGRCGMASSCFASTTCGFAPSSTGSAVARSRRPATASWRCSTRPFGPSAARPPWDPRSPIWDQDPSRPAHRRDRVRCRPSPGRRGPRGRPDRRTGRS